MTYRKKLEREKRLQGNDNLANFQFVQAINSLTGMNYDLDCNKFSLRDKAHVRNLIQLAKASQVREKSVLADSVASLKSLKNTHPKVAESVQAFEQNIAALEQENAMLDDLSQREEEEFVQEAERRRGLVGQLEELKQEFEQMKMARNEQERGVAERCQETIKILERRKADLTKEIEPLQIQCETLRVKDSISLEAEQQAARSELLAMENELKEYQIKTTQLTFNANEFLRCKEKEYALIQAEWENVMQERRGRLNQLDELKEKERELRLMIEEASQQTKWASRMENVLKLEEESEVRNKKYNLPPRHSKQESEQKPSVDTLSRSPQSQSRKPTGLKEAVSPSIIDAKMVATSTTGSKTRVATPYGNKSDNRPESAMRRSEDYFLLQAQMSPRDPESSYQDMSIQRQTADLKPQSGLLHFQIPNISAANSVPPSEEVRYESAESSSPDRLPANFRQKQSILSHQSKRTDQNSEAGLTFAGKFQVDEGLGNVQSNRHLASQVSDSLKPRILPKQAASSSHFLDKDVEKHERHRFESAEPLETGSTVNAALEEVVTQSKDKFRKMEQLVEMMLSLHEREQEQAQPESRGSLGYSSSEHEHSGVTRDVERLRRMVADVLRELS